MTAYYLEGICLVTRHESLVAVFITRPSPLATNHCFMDRWQQVDKLLEEALEQEPDRRDAFLDEACNGDVALRQEVESLLSAHGKAGDFIEAPALEVAIPASPGAGVRIVAGQQLGPYKIVSLLGAGGMGEVYRAKDDRIGRSGD